MKRWPGVRLELAALAAVLLLAAFLRLWRLEELPPGLYHDEAYNGLDALSLTEGATFPRFYEGWELYAAEAHSLRAAQATRFPVFFEGNYGREPLHVYLMALSLRLLGVRPLAVRLVPALAGILAVLTTYLAARALFPARRPLPLLAAFFLAILVPAIHFSRFGLRVMLFVPFECLAVASFWQGYRAAGRTSSTWSMARWFALAGILLGGALYTYAAARLFPLVFLLFVALWAWQHPAQRRRAWAALGLMGLSALLVALPLLLFFLRYPYFFLFRIAYVANKGKGTVAGRPWLTWLENVGRVLRGLLWQGESHLRHNLPGRPYLDAIQATFFLLGTLTSLARRRPAQLFLLLWAGGMLLPSVLSGDAPHFGRMAGVAAPAAILAAAGMLYLVDRLGHRLPGLLPLLAGLLLFSTFVSVRDYFGRYASLPQLAGDFYLPDWQLGRYAAAAPPGTTLYLSPTQAEMATIFFALGRRWPELRSYNGNDGALPAGIPGHPSLYLLRPDQVPALERLRRAFPRRLEGPGRPGFLPVAVPPAAAAAAPLQVWGDQIRLLAWQAKLEPGELALSLTWQAAGQPAAAYTAFVHLLDSAGNLVTQSDRPPAGFPTADWRPDEVVADTFHLSLPDGLPPGPYTLLTGFYDPATLQRLGQPAPVGQVVLP